MDEESEKIVNEVHKKAQETDMKQFNWSKAIVDGYGQVDEKIRYRCCYFYYKKFISSKEMDTVLQKLVHSLKDLILLIRYFGTKIQRPNDPYEYMQRLFDLFDEINDKLNKNGAIFLIAIGTVVSGNMGSKNAFQAVGQGHFFKRNFRKMSFLLGMAVCS